MWEIWLKFTEPVRIRICYHYGTYQSMFNNYPAVHFEEGLYKLSDKALSGREPTLLIGDDYMSDINQLVSDIFTKFSHQHDISILHLTPNLFDRNKYAITISLNAHYLVLFKNPRDASQFAVLARQMYPNSWKFAAEGYEDATSTPYGYLMLDLKSDQDERCRLRTNTFRGEQPYVYIPKWKVYKYSAWMIMDSIWVMLHLNIRWANIIVNNWKPLQH